MIEEVKEKILKYLGGSSYAGMWDDCAREICRLFEPKPDEDEETRAKIAKSNAIGMGLIPPAEGGLLTDEGIDKEHNKWCMRRGANLKISWRRWIAKAQRDLTVSIKDAEIVILQKEIEVKRAEILSLAHTCEELDAECQERVIAFIDWLDNGTRSSASWRAEVRKFRQAHLKEGVK